MTIESVLTDVEIGVCICRVYDKSNAREIGELRLSSHIVPIGRAIEQAVLQSDEVKMFREIAYALIMFQADYEQCAGQSMPGNEHWSERLMQIVDMADAAMEKQP